MYEFMDFITALVVTACFMHQIMTFITERMFSKTTTSEKVVLVVVIYSLAFQAYVL